MKLMLSFDDTGPGVAEHDATLATQLTNEVLGTNLRELFPLSEAPTRWQPESALMAVRALREQSSALSSSPSPSFPGLFGTEQEPQDIYEKPEAEISEEDRSKIQWKQAYTKEDTSWLRFSFESPLPTKQEGESTPDPRLDQLEQELTALETFISTALDTNASIKVAPSDPAPATPAPTEENAPTETPTIGGTPVPAPTPTPESTPTPEPVPTATEEASASGTEETPTDQLPNG